MIIDKSNMVLRINLQNNKSNEGVLSRINNP
jgi:hypothetical protein